MKNFIVPAWMVFTFLCGGCYRSDTASIEELNRKVDWIMQAQSLIVSNQIDLNARISALPNLRAIDDVSRFYYSNSVWHVESEFTNQSRLITEENECVSSNLLTRLSRIDTDILRR
jgi:hypothetical protein